MRLAPSAERELARLDPPVRRRVWARIQALGNNPRPAASEPLKGTDGRRLRVGDYRVLYRIEQDALEILVVRVAHRREVYRRL